MATKGGKAKGKGKGKDKGPIKPQNELSLKGRKLVSDIRYVGSIGEWCGSWGWIQPLEVVDHPQIRKNKGRIYVHRTDSRGYVKMDVGVQLDFKIYCDARGLGAIDCMQVKQVSKEVAAAVAAASEGAPLPEGWEKHWSADHGEHFYWNRLTKETSWVPPEPADSEDESRNDLPLPPGWSKHYDDEHHLWYYWDKTKKRASWERPTEPAESPAPASAAAREPPAKKAKKSSAPESPVLEQKRVKGLIAEWHGLFGSITPLEDISEDLRPLLEKSDHKIYLNWRDVMPGVEIKVGIEVDFALYEDENGIAASDVRLHGKSATAENPARVADSLAEQWAEEDEAAAGEAAEEAAAAAEEGDEENSGPLLPGWEQVWSDEHGCNYYWHTDTKVAVWERPSIPIDESEDETQDKSDGNVWEGEDSEAGASQKATPMTPFMSQGGASMTPVTPGAAKGSAASKVKDEYDTVKRAPQTAGARPTGGKIMPIVPISKGTIKPIIRQPWRPQVSQRQAVTTSRRYFQAWER